MSTLYQRKLYVFSVEKIKFYLKTVTLNTSYLPQFLKYFFNTFSLHLFIKYQIQQHIRMLQPFYFNLTEKWCLKK